MSKRIRSAKGEIVDFDILTIKSQIAAGNALKENDVPKIEVARKDTFISKKAKRISSKTTVDKISTVDVAPKPTN